MTLTHFQFKSPSALICSLGKLAYIFNQKSYVSFGALVQFRPPGGGERGGGLGLHYYEYVDRHILLSPETHYLFSLDYPLLVTVQKQEKIHISLLVKMPTLLYSIDFPAISLKR